MKPTVPETGRVIRLEGNAAVVMIEGGKGCKGCGAAKIGLCRAGGTTMFLTAGNTPLAKPGDQVILGIDRRTQLVGYLLAYIIPLAAFIGGAFAGNLLGARFGMPSLDVILSFVSFVSASAVSLRGLRKLDRSSRMEIKRIVSDGQFTEFCETEEERLYLKYTPQLHKNIHSQQG